MSADIKRFPKWTKQRHHVLPCLHTCHMITFCFVFLIIIINLLALWFIPRADCCFYLLVELGAGSYQQACFLCCILFEVESQKFHFWSQNYQLECLLSSMGEAPLTLTSQCSVHKE